MKIKSGFIKRNIAGSNIVVPVGENAKSFNAMITLNDSASFFWDCFQKDITVEECTALVCAEYDVDEEKARTDVEAFVKMLGDNGLIE